MTIDVSGKTKNVHLMNLVTLRRVSAWGTAKDTMEEMEIMAKMQVPSHFIHFLFTRSATGG